MKSKNPWYNPRGGFQLPKPLRSPVSEIQVSGTRERLEPADATSKSRRKPGSGDKSGGKGGLGGLGGAIGTIAITGHYFHDRFI